MHDTDIVRVDMLFLWPRSTEFSFSGYGLAVGDGRKDMLIGLPMVDKPFPASEVWRVSVGQEFGEVTLFAMTLGRALHGLSHAYRRQESGLCPQAGYAHDRADGPGGSAAAG